jgi:hypothetical protein
VGVRCAGPAFVVFGFVDGELVELADEFAQPGALSNQDW